MKRFLQQNVERYRHLTMLLVTLCGFLTANAQLQSDDISAAILVEGSVPVRWTNDAQHPWYIATDENGSYMRTPETEEDYMFTSTMSFTYSSKYPVEVTFNWRRYRWWDDNFLTVIVDGNEQFAEGANSWTNEHATFMIPAGDHTVQFVSNSMYSGYDINNYWGGIRNLRVWECKEPEAACLKEGSLPLHFDNVGDLDKIWITEDGYVRSTNTSTPTAISTTFTIDRLSLFSCELLNTRNHDAYSRSYIIIDGEEFRYASEQFWTPYAIVLDPGTHTIEFQNRMSEPSSVHVTQIRNVCLDQNWYEVTNNSGELGIRMTQVLEGKPLQDMELLKIRGELNYTDWDNIKRLTGIKGIDLTETSITSIPDGAFDGLSNLSTVLLPDGLKIIEHNAFKCANFDHITIPASVESIGNQVWKDTPLRHIVFEENSQLKSIGCSTFENARNLIEFDMPDSVETLGLYQSYWQGYYELASSLFAGCSSLKRLHLSDNLSDVPILLASECNSLSEVNIPVFATSIGRQAFNRTNISSIDIPETVTSIGYTAFEYCPLESVTIPKEAILGYGVFRYCKNLKDVVLNSHCWDMDAIFDECTALEKIVLPCATPPSIKNDPFINVAKSSLTLIVPDFAFDTYRADSYWYAFRNTVKGDEASINDYWAIRGTLNLNNTLVMQGNPSVEMMQGGILTLGANSVQTFNEFTYNTSESSPAVVLSQSNSLKSDRLISKFYVDEADHWYFFSPLTDVNMSDVTYPSTDSWVIRYYDGARRASEDASSGNWVNVPSDGTLRSGQGYIIQARAAGWLYLPAAAAEEHDKFFGANAVTFELADNACATEANAGWNFVANPYPTFYDIYYIDMQAPITVWDGSTYRAYSLNDGDRGDDTFVLRPMQPFFVQKNAADLSTGMPLVGRQINTTIDRSRAPRPVVVDENRHKLNLELYCNDNEIADDYTRVVLNEGASLSYETVRDASKFMTMDAEVAQLYTLGADGHPMAINERPYEDGNVALGVLLPSADRTYRIAARRADRKAWLYDAETGIEQDLTDGDYIFAASRTGIDNKRFSIRFAPATTGVEGVETSAVKVTGNIGSISVIAPADATVTVYGTDGSVITDMVATDGQLEIAVAAGVYVVKVNGESHKTIVK